ncbi:Wzz/FepE/Etk N-terminal domain-containing protein [Pullulanibacillus sp. KACC 23026]|uniref:YveK family protein n=1 Tax=Pullulanibacillus sp. KACC 23026 TaxID=3028315 RepID=UPI0023B0D298|nr:Wzz/FepE/Etk N-terminal domain-containing protein [Pullulanibacillus sp. KACC 23026]WEG11524.1 Wzz/FepE/Etk N-terminal domain-containing protein [Pullulanibacillus sp. KACC 23026]
MSNFEQETLPHSKRLKEIDLKEIFSVLKRYYVSILIFTLFGSALCYWYSIEHQPKPSYQASTRVLISSNGPQNDASTLSTLMVMFTDPNVLSNVSNHIMSKRSPNVLSNEISVTNINDSQIIDLRVSDSDPYLVREIANTEVSVFKDEVARVLNFKNVRQLSPAEVESVNNGMNHKLILYGGVAGLILGICLAFLRNSMDESIRTEKELEVLLQLPVVGSITKMTKSTSEKAKNKSQRQRFLVERRDPLSSRLEEETEKRKQLNERNILQERQTQARHDYL